MSTTGMDRLQLIVGAGMGLGIGPNRHPRRDGEGHGPDGEGGKVDKTDTDDDDDAGDEDEDDDEGNDGGDDSDGELQRIKGFARDWEKKAKASNKQLEQVKQLLGLGKNDTLDPKQLKAALEESQGTSSELARDNAILRVANKLKVDADDLTDSKKFMAKVDALDPEDDGYNAKLRKLVEAEAKARNLLGTSDDDESPKKAKKGGTPLKGDKPVTQLTREDLKGMSPEAIVKAQNEGRLKDLLGQK